MTAATTDGRMDVLQLQARYGDLVTRRDWAGVHRLFLPDCTLHLDLRTTTIDRTGADEIVDFVSTGVGRFDFFLFTIVNSVVEVAADGDRASARLYIRELRTDQDGRESTAFGLYRDECRRTPAGWRFARRDYATLARTAASGSGFESFPVPGDDDRGRPTR